MKHFIVGAKRPIVLRNKDPLPRDLSHVESIESGQFKESFSKLSLLYSSTNNSSVKDVPKSIVPTIQHSMAPLPTKIHLKENLELPSIQTSGPYYQYSVTPSEIEFILQSLPNAVLFFHHPISIES